MKAMKIIILILAWSLFGVSTQEHFPELIRLWMVVFMVGLFVCTYAVMENKSAPNVNEEARKEDCPEDHDFCACGAGKYRFQEVCWQCEKDKPRPTYREGGVDE